MSTAVRVEKQPQFSGNVSFDENSSTGTTTERYTVYMSDRFATPESAMTASTTLAGSIPKFGAMLGSYVLTGKSATKRDNKETIWDVECTYTIPKPGQESKPADDEIERWSINFNIYSQPREVPIERDADGKVIMNTVGDALEGVTTDISDEIWDIDFSCVEVDQDGIASCINGVNLYEFSLTVNGQEVTFPVGTLLFKSYSISSRTDPNNAQTYPRMRYQLWYRDGGWNGNYANKGYRKLINGVKNTILDDYSCPITSPAYLSANGSLTLSPGDTAATVTVKRFKSVDLGAMLLYDMST